MTEGFPHSPLFGENGRNKSWISLLRSDLATPSARCATPPIYSAKLRNQRETSFFHLLLYLTFAIFG